MWCSILLPTRKQKKRTESNLSRAVEIVWDGGMKATVCRRFECETTEYEDVKENVKRRTRETRESLHTYRITVFVCRWNFINIKRGDLECGMCAAPSMLLAHHFHCLRIAFGDKTFENRKIHKNDCTLRYMYSNLITHFRWIHSVLVVCGGRGRGRGQESR